jgi:eukaryotic-like serine/threonine-protein kinase
VDFQLPPDPRIGTLLAERYRIDALIGEGAMGKVYSAEHVMMHKRLAVKVLHRELTVVPELVARFEREAMAAANVDHPNIASATDFGKLEDESVFIALELVEGVCLRDAIAKGPIPLRRSLHIGRQIAAALGAAHQLSIVHRDLKPENVMLVDRNGDPDFVKVLDFGVAKVPIGDPSGGPGAITRVGTVFGTPEYIPPEQALGQPSDGRADLYSLGVILFEMLTGVRPFTSTSKVSLVGMHLSEPAPRLRDRAPGLNVPEAVEVLVARLLKKSASDRFEHASDVVKELDRLLAKPLFEPFERGFAARITHGARTLWADARAFARPRVASAVAFEQRHFERLVAFIETRRQALPKQAGDALARVPSRAFAVFLVTIVGLIVLLAVVGVGGALFKSKGPGAVPEPALPPAPSASATAAAGSVAGEASAAPTPSAAAPGVELEALLDQTKTRTLAKDYAGAVYAASRALALDPQAKNDGRIASALFQAAQAKDAADAAFKLLEGPMADRGAGIMHDLAVFGAKGSAAQKRAEAWLGSAPFNAAASPALRLAVRMRRAKSCAEVRALLPDVKSGGDKQSLPYLKFFSEHPAKYPCLKQDRLLDDTTSAVSARAAKVDAVTP